MQHKIITKGFTQAQLKLLAVIGMTLNHWAAIFRLSTTPIGIALSCFGMLAMPLFSLFVAEGYHYTSNHIKYFSRLVLAAGISHFAFAFAFNSPFPFTSAIYTLTLAYLSLHVLHLKTPLCYKTILATAIFILSLIGDWSWCAILWTVAFDVFRGNKSRQVISFVIVGILYAVFMGVFFSFTATSFAFLLALPFIYLYNGNLGHLPKPFKFGVYAYYPIHLVLLKLISLR